jgi:hypothetical protein
MKWENIDSKNPVVICRSAEPPEKIEGAVILGYRCRRCDKALQVSYDTLEMVARYGAQPLCNPCGGLFIQALTAASKLNPEMQVMLKLSPTATAAIEDETGESILETFPDAKTEILE